MTLGHEQRRRVGARHVCGPRGRRILRVQITCSSSTRNGMCLGHESSSAAPTSFEEGNARCDGRVGTRVEGTRRLRAAPKNLANFRRACWEKTCNILYNVYLDMDIDITSRRSFQVAT